MEIHSFVPNQPKASSRNPKEESPSKEPLLKRSNSLPARLPSQPYQPEEVKANRKSITRAASDIHPPLDFQDAGGKTAGAEIKLEFMKLIKQETVSSKWRAKRIKSDPDYREFLESIHPAFKKYNARQRSKAYNALADSHPRFLAEMAVRRNEMYSVPNATTPSRFMKPKEQKFLSEAMRLIKEDVEKKPFHIHGESGAVAKKNAKVNWFGYSAARSIETPLMKGGRHTLHSHPPYLEPFTSSASEPDHLAAAEAYLAYNNKMNHYVTNGKDVLLIHPASTELIKLVPDPKTEEKLGKFPEAFRLPDPRQPPRPFSNHEAPAPFIAGWKPPEGWKPDPDYPRTEFFPKQADPKAAKGEWAQETSPPSPRPVKTRKFGEA